MGIITKEVEVKVNSSTVEYYKSLGYEIPIKHASEAYFKNTGKEYVYDFSKTIFVNIKDLHKKSNVYIDILCDFCHGEIIHVRYADYNRVIEKTGSYVCQKCSFEKRKQTQIFNYGEIYFKTDEFKEKRKISMKEKYGVEHYLQNENNFKKYQEVCAKKYGENYINTFRKKAKESFLNKTGYLNPMEDPEIKEKVRNTNLERYGVPYAMQLPEVREKANKTLCKNGTQKTSSQQLYIHSIYGGELNFPISCYSTDICFPKEKLIIEYDGGGHDLRVTLGILSQEEFDKKEIVRNNIIKREGYKQMRIISNKDYLPSDEILLQMLEYTKQYFSDYPNHSWIYWDIDNLKIINAENKDTNGVFFDYGELRKIQKSA